MEMQAFEGWEEENFKNAYLSWLFHLLRADGYQVLFDVLYDTPFEWDRDLAPMDSNREADGRYLRKRFLEEEEPDIPVPPGYLEWPASFLEAVAALAVRVDDQIMYEPRSPCGPWTWFWEWMSNAGFDAHTDHEMLGGGSLSMMLVAERVAKIQERRYGASGEGGFFPLTDPGCDQRLEEMWDQACSYMGERHC